MFVVTKNRVRVFLLSFCFVFYMNLTGALVPEETLRNVKFQYISCLRKLALPTLILVITASDLQ